ncbi:MAG TPA: hypothetical protein VMI56_04395 [Reyranella sp.]|nr:hypothetical protein [Reyranella sp.]
MTKTVFAILRTRGPNWNDDRPMEGQVDWRAHADYMNALVDEGFMLLGGPLAGSRDVLLIVRAESEQEVETRFAEDVWSINDLLRTLRIDPWRLRLGSLAPT